MVKTSISIVPAPGVVTSISTGPVETGFGKGGVYCTRFIAVGVAVKVKVGVKVTVGVQVTVGV